MDAPFVSDFDFLTVSPPELRPFWKVLESFWGDFLKNFGLFCGYRFHSEFLYDFELIFHGF